MKKTTIYLSISIIIALCLNSCDSRVSEGKITYSIEYPSVDPENTILLALMPKEMDYYFKDNEFCTVLSSGANQFNMHLLTNSESRELVQSLKIGSKKLYTSMDENEVNDINIEDYGERKVEITDELVEIAGFNCQKAIVKFSNNNSEEDKVVYYTGDINVSNPNWSLPYNGIPGVPMDYELNFMGIDMRFKAKEFENIEVTDSILSAPTGYKKASYDEIKDEITEILSSLIEIDI